MLAVSVDMLLVGDFVFQEEIIQSSVAWGGRYYTMLSGVWHQGSWGWGVILPFSILDFDLTLCLYPQPLPWFLACFCCYLPCLDGFLPVSYWEDGGGITSYLGYRDVLVIGSSFWHLYYFSSSVLLCLTLQVSQFLFPVVN